MPRERRVRVHCSWIAAIALFAGAGCHSSSAGIGGKGDGAAGARGDAAGDLGGSAAGGGGGGAVNDGGTGAGGNGGANGDAATTGSGGAGVTDASGDLFGAGCNTLTPGTPVTLACAPDGGMPPAPTGGTIVPGTYTLTAVTEYGGCTQAALSQTAVLTANTVDTVADSTINGLSRENGTYVISGTDFVQTSTCPTGAMNTYQYSVTTTAGVTTMTLISGSPSNGLVAVFTKQ